MPTDYWAYDFIEALASRGVINGYADGTFRPGNTATRGQLSKIVVLGFNFALQNPPTAHFEDVAVGSTFFTYIETASARGADRGLPMRRAWRAVRPPVQALFPHKQQRDTRPNIKNYRNRSRVAAAKSPERHLLRRTPRLYLLPVCADSRFAKYPHRLPMWRSG